MPSQRRFSEDVNFRRPLATLHEDEVVARRRFSEDVRKKSVDTSGVMDDVYKHQRRLSEAGVRRLSDASLVLTEDTDSFIIGDRVWVGGTKSGVISYIGDTQFGPGEWAGVTLDEPIGKNDGSVGGVRYFQCEAKKGVFSRLTRLTREPLSDADIEIRAARASLSSDSPKTNGTPSSTTPSTTTPMRKATPAPATKTPTAKPSGPAPLPTTGIRKTSGSTSSSSEPKVGDRVVVASAAGGVRHGSMRFVGRTDFADGVWAGVELDEPTGKNDGSVAGKRYFTCRDKYGLFAPIARVSKFGSGGGTTPRRPTPASSQTPRVSMRRSNSRESLGASSVASSAASSSVRGSREALAEKTQHVEQLLRERDLERSELALMAAQLDEATRAAHTMKGQLDKLQEESEERLHDCGERIRVLEREKDELATRLDDRQRDFDDLAFRLEEEVITKADLESQNTTDGEKIKEMEKELEEVRKKLKERGREEFEAEELEISLRASVEELQGRVMELEKEKEDFENVTEKQKEELHNLKTASEALKNTVSEREQKIKLLETSREEEQAHSAERSSELSVKESLISAKDTTIQELNSKLEEKTKEAEDGLGKIQDLMRDRDKEKTEKESLQKEIKEIREQLECGSSEAATLMVEVSRLKEEMRDATTTHTTLSNTVSDLESEKKRLESEVEAHEGRTRQHQEELAAMVKQRDEDVANIKDNYEAMLKKLKQEQEDQLKGTEEIKTKFEGNELEYKNKLQELEKEIISLGDILKEKASQCSEASEKLSAANMKIQSLESLRFQLEEQIKASSALDSSTAEQLTTLTKQLQEKDRHLEEMDKQLLEKQRQIQETEMQKQNKELELEGKDRELGEIKAHLTEMKAAKTRENEEREKEKEIEIITKQKESEKYKQEIEQLKQQFKEAAKDIEKKAGEMESVRKQLCAEKEELTKRRDLELYELQEQLTLKDVEVMDMAAKVKSLEQQLSAMTSDIADKQGGLEATLAHISAEKEQHIKEKEEVIKSKMDLEARISVLEEDNLKLRTEREENLLAVTERDKKVAELKKEVENLMVSFATHREDLQKQLEQAHQDKANMVEFQKTFEGELACMNELQKALTSSEEIKDSIAAEKKQLEEELSRLKGIEDEKANLVKEKDKLVNEANKVVALETQCSLLKEEKGKATNEVNAKNEELKRERERWIEERNKMEEEIRCLRKSEEERSRLGGDVERLEAELTKMTQIKENNATLTSELERIRDDRQVLQSEVSNLKEELNIKAILEEDNLRLSTEVKSMSEENYQLKTDLKNRESEIDSKNKELETNQTKEKERVKSLEEEKIRGKEEQDNLQKKLKELEQVEAEKKDLVSKNKSLIQDLEEIRISHEERVGEMELEKFTLAEQVEGLQDKLTALQSSMAETTRKSKEAEEKAEAADILRAKINLMETEKRRLESRIVDLQVERASTEISHNDYDNSVQQIKDEKEQLDSQVSFLNSIIVDMQRKNDELRVRLEVFESGNIPDDTKANMNGSSSGIRPVAPRLFCDICDKFDAHDTEDCPCQASSDSPPPSLHHGQRGVSRPYCTTCEVFGHETDQCNEDETF